MRCFGSRSSLPIIVYLALLPTAALSSISSKNFKKRTIVSTFCKKGSTMQSLRKIFCLCCTIVFVAVLTSASAFAQATVTTDRTDYQPGDSVYITGSGFQAGEAV